MGTHLTKPDLLSLVTMAFLAMLCLVIVLLVYADVAYVVKKGMSARDLWRILSSRDVLAGMRLSAITSLVTLLLVVVISVPSGYALSRGRFRGWAVANMIVDIPLVLPPVVVGLSLLAFFGSNPIGICLKDTLKQFDLSLTSPIGIVLCQFLLSVPYCVRSAKTSFDGVSPDLENVALTLGCSNWQAFRRVTLPLSGNGIVAGAVMAWARAVGVFGPVMIFVGTSTRVQIMPTAIWVELNTGNIEKAFAISLIMVAMAGAALTVVHWLAPGRKGSTQ